MELVFVQDVTVFGQTIQNLHSVISLPSLSPKTAALGWLVGLSEGFEGFMVFLLSLEFMRFSMALD